MRILRLFIFVLVLFILQTVVLSRLFVFGAHFDVLLVFVICWGLMNGAPEGLAAGILTGLLADASTASTFFFSGIYGAAGYLCGILRSGVFRDDNVVIFGMVLAVTFITRLAEAFSLMQFSGRDVPSFIAAAFLSSLLNILLVPLIMISMEKINKDG